MIKRIKQLNKALPLLILGIICWGILVQFSAVWFVEDKLRYSTGTWIGVACAIFMAFHLAFTIEGAVDKGDGQWKLRIKSILRYIVVVLVFLALVFLNIGNPIAAFVAALGLKVSAYVQPFIYKLIHRKDQNEEKEVKL